MPSPFPGMDPYLEDPDEWPEFHLTFLHVCKKALYEHLPGDYDARVERRIQVVDFSDLDPSRYVPDVTVWRDPAAGPPTAPGSGGGGTATLQPTTVRMAVLPEVPESFLEIRRRPNRELVTVVELLSPSNKRSPGFNAYVTKRQHLIYDGVNVVDLDLLVGGRRLLTRRHLPVGDYYGFVSRPERWPDTEVFSWGIRDGLPTIAVPLRAPDAAVPLDLGRALTAAYDEGRFERVLQYDQPPSAYFGAEVQPWVIETGRSALAPRRGDEARAAPGANG